MFTAVAVPQWNRVYQDEVTLAVLPYFHVTGMQNSMNSPIYSGGTIVLLPRWDRAVAAQLIDIEVFGQGNTLTVGTGANQNGTSIYGDLVTLHGTGGILQGVRMLGQRVSKPQPPASRVAPGRSLSSLLRP